MKLCHFDFHYIQFIDKFLVVMADFHYAFSDTAQKKHIKVHKVKKKKAHKVIASPERS